MYNKGAGVPRAGDNMRLELRRLPQVLFVLLISVFSNVEIVDDAEAWVSSEAGALDASSDRSPQSPRRSGPAHHIPTQARPDRPQREEVVMSKVVVRTAARAA